MLFACLLILQKSGEMIFLNNLAHSMAPNDRTLFGAIPAHGKKPLRTLPF